MKKLMLLFLAVIFLSGFTGLNIKGHVGSLCNIGTVNSGWVECTASFSFGDYTFDSYQVAIFR